MTTSMREQRVVITKDADFIYSFLVLGQPHKLLLISTGNIANTELMTLLRAFLSSICDELASHDFLELDRTGLIVHF